MKGELEYKMASVKDMDGIVALQTKLAEMHVDIDKYYALRPNYQAAVRTFFTEKMKSKEALFYVAEFDGKMVGYLFCSVVEGTPVFRFKKYLEISDLFVDPAFRRKHVAQRFFDEAKRFAKRCSVDFIVCNPDVGNIPAQKLCAKNGLKPIIAKMIFRM
ncbi:MAG: GNAT family N-acetyltransferase [Candidatus Diapherotrites archaeon]|nr:GNAT family N-acetyltransferase [Candidatus Diapherotrites archaeon]